MNSRLAFAGLSLAMTLSLVGCSTTVQSVKVFPGAGVEVLNSIGQTVQFHATETSQTGSSQPDTHDATHSVTWISGNTAVATIDQTGKATAVGVGTAQITAQDGGASDTSDVSVNPPASGPPPVAPSLTIIPSGGAAVATRVGETTQFIAVGDLNGSGTPQDVTDSVRWVSSDVSVATITQSGLATGVAAVSAQNVTTITAIATTASGAAITATSNLTIISTSDPILTIIPADGATTTRIGETTQFLAIGDLSGSGKLQDLTNSVRWVSSDVAVATIDQAGLATGVSAVDLENTTIITAIGTTPGGGVITVTSNLRVIIPSNTPVPLPTLAIYKAGAGTGTVTSSPSGINCGPHVTCTGTFPVNTLITLTAAPYAGSSFGGWSSNCVTAPASPANTCQLTLTTSNETVGAIFNTP